MKNVFRNFDLFLSGAFLCVTVAVVIINVLLRYSPHGGFYWAEEVATLSFIWSVFVGSAAAYRCKMHIGIDIITKIGPPRFRTFVAILIDLMMLVINGYIVYLSILFSQANSLKRTPVLDIPALYVNLSLTVGFALIAAYAVVFLIRDMRQLVSPQASSTALKEGEQS